MEIKSKLKKNKKLRQRGRKVNFEVREELAKLLGVSNYRRDHLIEYLHVIQDNKGHINEDFIAALAHLLDISQTEVYEVATFYHHFDIIKNNDTVPPSLTVRVCDSVTCEINGANELAQSLDDYYKGTVRIQKVPCIGRCQHAPVAVVKFNPIDNANLKNVKQAVDAKNYHPTIPNYISIEEYVKKDGYKLFEKVKNNDGEKERVLKELESSNLRGLGGAGFPAGRKWRILKDQQSPRLLAVNIDEGEPGTFKDRYYLESDPHRFFEGMLIASEVVGIDKIYIYLRDEYAAVRKIMEDELEKINTRYKGSIPEIELRRGAGAYICGEESAMIESIEGKRGLPRHRPPYVAQRGIFNKPTLVNNIETLFWIRDIIEKGGQDFAIKGSENNPGPRSYSVSGRVKFPGVIISHAGSTANELIEKCGGLLDGHKFKAYLPGGASGGILPSSKADIPLDFGGELSKHGCFVGSHAVVILSDKDNIADVALNLVSFFKHESCGQCTPCRNGTEKIINIINKSVSWDKELLNDISEVMANASICGLGQAAPNPILSVMKFFPKDVGI